MRIMLDSNVHDLIVANQAALVALQKRIKDGKLKLVTTHIQRDELSRAPEPKRAPLLAIYDLAEKVVTTGAVFDVSGWDECSWASDDVSAGIRALMVGNHRHAEDALIAATAADEADALVIDDARLTSKIRRTGFTGDVWPWSRFVEWLDCRA